MFQVDRVVVNALKYLPRLFVSPETDKSLRAPIGYIRDRVDLHLLKVPAVPRRTLPVQFRCRFVEIYRMRHTEPVVNHAQIHQQMLGLTDAMWEVPRCLKSPNRSGCLSLRQSLLAKQ